MSYRKYDSRMLQPKSYRKFDLRFFWKSGPWFLFICPTRLVPRGEPLGIAAEYWYNNVEYWYNNWDCGDGSVVSA